jgi:GNAT superfamily N-acetyltransferase
LARQDARRKVAAPFVLVDVNGAVIGYYTLSAYTILLAELPVLTQKRLPKYPLVPVTLLGRLAVSASHQGQNLGQFLLMDALYRSWKYSAEVALCCCRCGRHNEHARSFYLHHGFIPLEGHANKLLLPMTTLEKSFK